MDQALMLLHATGVVRDGHAALLTGPSGAGKSDLALRLIDRGWTLLADDYVGIALREGSVRALAPEATRGLIEVRGIGLVRISSTDEAPVALIVDLVAEVERMPEPVTRLLLGVALPCFTLDPWQASAPIKLELAFARALAGLSANLP